MLLTLDITISLIPFIFAAYRPGVHITGSLTELVTCAAAVVGV
jgi:hypothetical protein